MGASTTGKFIGWGKGGFRQFSSMRVNIVQKLTAGKGTTLTFFPAKAKTLVMKKIFANYRVGILGGGQLARMLIQQGQRLGLEMHVLCPSSQEPGAQVTQHWHKGNPKNEADLRAFFKKVDLVTFESEFLNGPQLDQLSQDLKLPVYPHPPLMERLQDRLTQKQLLEKFHLPSAPYVEVKTEEDLQLAFKRFPKGLVLKKRRYGYDGYGTFVIRTKPQLKKVIPQLSKNWDGFIAEEFIPFKRELAFMAVRSIKGEILNLPLVESQQKDNRCFWVKGPIANKFFPALSRKTKTFLKELDYTGVMGFELFETQKGLLVNEIAPRVHNSGHYSLDALASDQFSLHLKALLGMKLGPVELNRPGFAMLNLLGEKGGDPKWDLPPNLFLHWYGKVENRSGRKMGHLNALGSTPQRALTRLLNAKKEFRL